MSPRNVAEKQHIMEFATFHNGTQTHLLIDLSDKKGFSYSQFSELVQNRSAYVDASGYSCI